MSNFFSITKVLSWSLLMSWKYVEIVKSLLFPIHKNEKKSFTLVFLLYFCLAFIYNVLRPIKITLVTSASHAGAEVIPFLKIWGIVPGAFLFTYIVTRLSKFLSRESIFYVMTGIFLSYYFIFAVFFIPYNESLSLSGLANYLNANLPSGYRGLISMIQYWHVSLFYVLCEVWSSVIMFMLFWGFVNEVTPMESAARFYPLYNLGGNLASTLAGWLLLKISKLEFQLPLFSKLNPISNFSILIILLSMAFGVFAIVLFRMIHSNARFDDEQQSSMKIKTKKSSFTLSESIAEVGRSKYLLFMLILVLAYNLVFNLTDVLWNQEVKNYFGSDQIKMAGFIGEVTMYKGLFSLALVFAAQFIIKKFGWRAATCITPVIILLTSLIFFPLVYLQQNKFAESIILDMFQCSLAWIAVLVGGVQNALARGTKYSIYDSTKEMAFIPLSLDEKRKGKAVIDGIASRIGKSSGSVVFIILLPFCSNLQSTIPYVAMISMSVTILWVFAIYGLDKQMHLKKNSSKLN